MKQPSRQTRYFQRDESDPAAAVNPVHAATASRRWAGNGASPWRDGGESSRFRTPIDGRHAAGRGDPAGHFHGRLGEGEHVARWAQDERHTARRPLNVAVSATTHGDHNRGSRERYPDHDHWNADYYRGWYHPGSNPRHSSDWREAYYDDFDAVDDPNPATRFAESRPRRHREPISLSTFGSDVFGGISDRQRRDRVGPRGYVRSDERICDDICERLHHSYHLEVQDVSVQVSKGIVTLDGTVPERAMKHCIEDIAERCLGVRDIDNRIRVSRANADGNEPA
ncbi:MAG: BON domain-containing protein [Panacagrimonas sp.]